MEKYGFVYVWFDRKHTRFYIGCRWGREDDGYVCSSTWMKNSYKRRPGDFKRRVVARVFTTRQDLLTEEHRWLLMIKDSELGSRYYNLHKHHFGHWSTCPEATKTIGQKISEATKGKKAWNKGMKLGPQSEDRRAKTSKWLLENSPMRGRQHTEETKEKMSASLKGRKKAPRSQAHRDKLSQVNTLYKYQVGDTVFESLKQLSHALGVKVGTARRRMKSNNFTDWQMVRI